MSDGFPTDSFSSSENEICLYIDEILAFNLVGKTFGNAKVEGNLVMDEGYLTTYLLPALAQDNITKEWFTTLPQPPVGLPLGYSLDLAYFANSSQGRGVQVHLIRSKRVALRRNLPRQFGVDGWVEGSKFILVASDGGSLFNQNLYVRMAKTRTESLNEVLNMPDDAISLIFDKVVAKLMQRMGIPKDILQDDLPIGATNITNK